MGVFSVRVELLSRDGSRQVEFDAVVDAGATFTKVTPAVAHDLGLVPEFRSRVRLGNGEFVSREVGPLLLRWQDTTATIPVAIGGEGEVPVLGATALEILGLWVDPSGRSLVFRDALDLVMAAV